MNLPFTTPETVACAFTFCPIRAGIEPVRIDVGPQLNIPVRSENVKLYTSPQELVMRNNDRDIALRTITIKHPIISRSFRIL
jgi:hypothetical protein